MSKFPLLSSDGRVSLVGGIATDITERQEAEKTIRSISAFREAIIRTAAEGICVFFPIVEFPGVGLSIWNERMFEITGYTMDEINRCGWSQSLFRDGEGQNNSQEFTTRIFEEIDMRLEEWEITRKDGERRIVAISTSCVETETNVKGVIALIQDITERKQAEIALQKSEARFRLLFEGANDAIFLADAATGILTDCNKSAEMLLGRERSEIIGQPQSFLHPPENLDQIRRIFQEHASLKLTTHIETKVQRKDGGKVVVSIAPSVTTIGTQRIIQGVFRNITERKRIEEELRESRQRLEVLSRQLITTQESERHHLARELHDEIGQVLTAIKMKLRRSQQSADAGLQSTLEECMDMVDQAVGQVRNLTLQLKPPQLDELGLVAALHWLVKQQASLGGIEEQLEVGIRDLELPKDLETVCFRITQEALTNAIRHGEPRKIHVKLWSTVNKLFLSIHDNGIGFDVSECHRRALSGSSFGLVSIQERASLAGGHAKIESVKGQGTTVNVWLPLPHQEPNEEIDSHDD